MTAVGKRGEVRRVLGVDIVAVARQVQLANDPFLKQAAEVGRRRNLESGECLLGHAGAAEYGPALEHQDAQASTREIGRTNEPVMPSSDNYRIPCFSHSHTRFLGDS